MACSGNFMCRFLRYDFSCQKSLHGGISLGEFSIGMISSKIHQPNPVLNPVCIQNWFESTLFVCCFTNYVFFSPPFICSDYEHVSSSSEYHPFNEQGYEIPKPDVPLVYGFPNIPIFQSSPNLPESTDTIHLATPTATDANTFSDSTTILTGDSLNSRKKRSLFHSQPKSIEITSTTARPTRPRTRYDDEGKWKIIRQEEDKQEKKYDYLWVNMMFIDKHTHFCYSRFIFLNFIIFCSFDGRIASKLKIKSLHKRLAKYLEKIKRAPMALDGTNT